jgi:hypothetical protein
VKEEDVKVEVPGGPEMLEPGGAETLPTSFLISSSNTKAMGTLAASRWKFR